MYSGLKLWWCSPDTCWDWLKPLSKIKKGLRFRRNIAHLSPRSKVSKGPSLTVLLCLGQLHQLLLFQCVHHVCQAAFAAFRRPKRQADDGLPAIPGGLLRLVWRGRVSLVGVDGTAFVAFTVLIKTSTHESVGLEVGLVHRCSSFRRSPDYLISLWWNSIRLCSDFWCDFGCRLTVGSRPNA